MARKTVKVCMSVKLSVNYERIGFKVFGKLTIFLNEDVKLEKRLFLSSRLDSLLFSFAFVMVHSEIRNRQPSVVFDFT